MDGVDRHRPTAVEIAERGDDHVAGRSERDGRIEGWRGLLVSARRRRAEGDGPLPLPVRPGANVHLASPVPGDLEREMGGRSEPEQPEPTTGFDPRHLERPIADDPAAQQWGCIERVVETGRQSKGEAGVDRDPLRIPAVAVPTGEPGRRAQVLASARAEPAGPARSRDPADPGQVPGAPVEDALTDLRDPPDRLMPGDDRQWARRKIPLHQLENPSDTRHTR